MAAATGVAARIAVAGVLAVGAAVASTATAAADPPPPADPAAAASPADPTPAPDPGPPPTAMGTMRDVLGQSNASPSGFDLVLSQTPTPALPGSQPASPPTNVLNTPQYLFGPNMKLAEQGQQSIYSAGPTDPNAPPASGRIDAFQRAHGLWHMGIGQMPKDQLGQPLPGTAPPPGTNLPAGPVEFLPDPSPAAAPAPPPPPG